MLTFVYMYVLNRGWNRIMPQHSHVEKAVCKRGWWEGRVWCSRALSSGEFSSNNQHLSLAVVLSKSIWLVDVGLFIGCYFYYDVGHNTIFVIKLEWSAVMMAFLISPPAFYSREHCFTGVLVQMFDLLETRLVDKESFIHLYFLEVFLSSVSGDKNT